MPYHQVKPSKYMNFKKPVRTSLIAISIVFSMVLSSVAKADPVWIDVRSEREHQADSIDGDVRIGHVEIVRQASELFPDKGTELQLYCRSGGRAGKAMAALQKAGYTNVSNAGGIGDARKARGLLAD